MPNATNYDKAYYRAVIRPTLSAIKLNCSIGHRQRRVLDAADVIVTRASDYPGCFRVASKALCAFFVVRVSDWQIVA